ncbi:hypothetical protein OEZ86_013092 [Tetradesmus obliquus]|nr:hypothetical protein OEZ86_013092 [Tetradesmus obliquus]
MALDTAASTRQPSEVHRLDEPRLLSYLRQQLPNLPAGSLSSKQFQHGQSNPTYLLEVGGQRLVLRKQPPGKLLASAHAVDREFKVLAALSQAGKVPVPRPLCMCSDASVIGTPFYVMEFAAGTIFTNPNLPDVGPRDRGRIYRGLAATLAGLHSLEPAALGLTGFGNPQHYCRRQVGRWSQQYNASVARPMPTVQRLVAWLGANVPAEDAAPPAPAVVHGDFRLDNLVYDEQLQPCAVLDWELATLGNPWADVAYLAMPYHLPPQLASLSLKQPLPGGIPSEERLLEAYSTARGVARPSARDWAFYLALSIFRLLAILAGEQGVELTAPT